MNRISLTVAALILAVTLGAAAQDGRPPVSWVNPDLPDGPNLSHHVLASTALGHDVGYALYLPPEYDEQPDRAFPVIVFLHGMGGDESKDAAGFSGAVASAVREGTLPPSIVLFPNGGRSGYRGEVEAMIVDELIPLVDREYRTRGADGRVAAGFSMGGAGVVRLAIAHPELFRRVASWGGGMRGDAAEGVRANADALRERGVAFLTINGDEDRPDAFDSLAEVADAEGLSHEHVVLPDTGHNLGKYYSDSAPRMMAFLGEALKNE